MYEQKQTYSPCITRFRKWSRKSYAAFSSLHRHVVMGHVGKGITEVSLSKGLLCTAAVHPTGNDCGNSTTEELMPPGADMLLTELCSPVAYFITMVLSTICSLRTVPAVVSLRILFFTLYYGYVPARLCTKEEGRNIAFFIP